MITKRFSKLMILTVCIILVFAVAAALLFDGSGNANLNGNSVADAGERADEVSGASYPVSADGYTHGSNIGRATSGTPINSASGLTSLLSGSGSGYLTTDITLSESESFTSTRTFTGTLYGNGHTVTVTGNQTAWQSVSDGSEIGGLVTKLSGTIYDLNVVLKSGTSAMYKSSDRQIKLGLIAGVIDNGTIENCTVTINSGSMLGAVSTNAASYSNGANCGAVAGQCNSSMTIKNVTVTNNGSIVGAVAKGNGYREGSGGASMFVGLIWNDNSSYVQKMDNLVTVGNGNVHGWASSMLGYLYTASTAYPITVTNYYNQFTGDYNYGSVSGGIFGSGTVQMVSYTLLKWKGSSDSSKVVNYYHSSSTNQGMMSSGYYAAPDNSITVAATEYKVGFDPKQTDTANSLVVYKSGVTGGENYSAAITTNSGTKYSDKYAFSDDGGTVIFRQLPTAISNWGGNNGTFNCTINITQNAVEVTPLPAVNKWESSYTTSQSSSGTAVDNGSKLTTAINNNQNIYLTADITDFKGFTHTGEYTGTLDGNGHTIYIVSGTANSSATVGGLFKRLSGTIKNVRIVLYNSYNRTISAGSIGTGIVAGNLCGGTVDNVYVYVPSDVTFGANGGSSYESYVGAIAGLSDAGYTISNTTVDVDGKMYLDGTYVYMAGFVGKSTTGDTALTAKIQNSIFKGNGSFASTRSNSAEPIYLAATTVLFQKAASNPKSSMIINGFIHAFKGGENNLTGGYSMYGVLTKNDNDGTMSQWDYSNTDGSVNISDIYYYNEPMGDAHKVSGSGNNFIDISSSKSTVSTTVDGSSIKVTPYFPAGDTTNLVLVAGDGSQSVPDLAYGDYKSTTDGSYKVVTVPKSAISAGSTVTLAEPVTPATPIADMNKWENGYVESSDVVPDGYTAVSDGAELANAIAANANIFLTADIMDYVGFNSASETDGGYSGIFDGNGHTVYIVKANTVSKQYVGGLFGKLKGTVKDVRIVVMAGVDLPSTTYVGAVAGALSGNANVSNVNVIINSGVNLVISGSSSNVGGAGGIAGGLTSGSGETVTISNSTVVLNGTLKATAQYTFIAGFVGHLNGGSVNYTDLTFKGNGMLDGVANAGEGVHTAGAGIVGGGVSAVNVNGFINSFNGSLSNGRSAYEVVVRNSQSTSISVNVSNVYTYGTVTTYDGSMKYGTPVACDKSTIATTVADSDIPVTPYFPVTNSGELVLVAGDGSDECPPVSYDDIVGVQEDNFTIVTIPKTAISANTTVTLVQGKAPVNDPTITTSSEDLVYNGGEIDVQIGQLTSGTTALQSGDYTVTVTAKEGGTGSVSNNKPVNAGDYVITVTLLNDYAFGDDSQTKTVEFSVAKKAVSIEGVTAQERPYDGTTDVTLSGGTLSGVATADEGKVGFDITGTLDSAAAGEGKTVNVTAVLNGEKAGNYELTSQPVVTATVTKLSVAVTWSDTSSFEYSGKAQAPTAAATGVGQESVNIVLTIKNAQGEVQAGGAVNAGTYTAEATTDNANYTLTNATKEFEITKKAISVGVTVAGWTYGDTASVPVVSGNDGNGDVTYLYEGQTNGGEEYSAATAPTDAGTYTVKITVAATQNYEAGEATSAQFTVAKKQLEKPTASDTAYVYTGTEQTYTPDGYDGATMNITGNVQTGADETGYAVTVTLKDTDNYEWTDSTADEAGFTFTIAKATLTDNTQNVVGTYNAAAHSLDIVLNGFVNGEDLESAGGAVKYGTQDGDYTLDSYGVTDAAKAVTVYYQITFDNYVTVVGNKTITVNAKQIAVVWDDMSQTYTGSALRPSASVNAGEVEGDDVVDIQVKTTSEGLETQAINVGTYGAAATTTNANYELTNASVDNFEITAADFDAAVQISGWTFGKAASQPTVTNNPGSGNVAYKYTGRGETVYEESETVPTNAGAYTVTATIAASGNYAQKVVSADFTIEKAVVEVPVIEDKQYTGDTITSGLVDNEYYTVQDDGGTEINVYYATLTLKNGNNYAWASGDDDNDGIIQVQYEIVAQDVSINSWTVSPAVKGWTYGGYTQENAPVYQAAYGNDTVDMQIRLKSGSDTDYVDAGDLSVLGAGVYLMKFSVAASIDPDGGESYTGLSAVVEFTVSKAAISVTVSIDGWTYGDVANKPTVGGITASGEVTYSYVGTGDTAYEESETAPVNAGTYKVTATVAETDNYFGATAEAEFTIAKKAITATVTAENAIYDGIEHAATVTFDGKLESDELTAELLYNGNAENPVNAGSYTVTVQSYGGAAVDNYDITTKDGEVKLVISPKELYIDDIETAAADPSDNGIYDGKEHAVKATVKYGVLYGDDVVTLKVLYNGSEDAPVNAGNYTLTFVVTDNGNYVMAEDQSKTVPVFKAKVSVKGVNATATYTGEAFEKGAIIKAVFGDADLSHVNVTVTYRQGDAAVNTDDIADVAITLKDEANYEFAAETVTSYTFTVTAGTVRLDGEDKTVEYKGGAYTKDEIKNAIFGEGTWADFVIEISYNNGAALNAGDTATVTVTGYSDENYALDPEMKTEYTFSVTTYKVAAPELSETSFVYNGGEQSVSLTGDTYVAISENVKTDKGDYNAVAALKDKENYEWITGGSADVELPWSITAKEVTLRAEASVDKVYDGAAYDFGGYVVAGADGFFGRDNVTVTVSAGEIYTPGTYAITVTHDANANYNVTVEPTEAKLIINKAMLTIGAKTAEIEYTGKVIEFEFDITGGKVGEDDVQIDGVTYRQNGVAISPIEAGTYDVEFTLKGAHAGYYNAGTAQVKITPQTATAPDGMTADSIILPEGDMIYNGEAHVATLNYEATDGNVYGIVYHNGTSYVDEAVNAGEYTVHVYKNTKTNIVEGISKTMTVEKRVITAADISVGGLEFTYSGGANNVTATGRGVKGEDVELVSLYDGEENAPVNAGTYTVTFRSADGNYTVAADVSYEMSVARASVVTPVAKNLTYNGEEQIAFENDAANRYTVGEVFKATDVSPDGYTATFTLVSNNYKWADHEQEKTINVVWNIAPYGVTIEISEAAKTKVYDGVALTDEELKALFNAPDKIGGGKVDIAVSVNNGGEVLDAGVYTVTAEIKDINYTAATAEVTFTVTQATPVAEPDVDDVILQEGYKLGNVGISVKEGGTAGVIVWDEPETLLVKGDNEVTWTFTPEDTVNYTTLSGTVILTVGDDVLDELVLVSGPDKTDYVAFEEFDGTGMLLKAVFNGGLKDQTFGVDKCRVVIENDVDGKMSAATTKVTVYYGEKFVEIEVNVSKITVTEPVLEVTELEYNAQMQTLPFEVGADEKYYVKGGNTATDVGNYNLEIELSDKVNYVWSSGSSENLTIGWKITPVSLGVEIDVPEDLVYDGYGKEATFRLVQGTLYGGAQLTIVYEQNGKVIDGLPVNAGEYDVVVKLPDVKNYRFASSYTAVMTIAKKVVTIKTNGDREKYYDGKEVTLEELAGNFTVSDGLKVKVTVSGTVLNAGSYKVTAVLDTANSNYTSNEVSYVYTVRKADRTVNATMSVGYRFVTVSVEGGNEGVEYSLDGFDWQPLDGNIAVELAAQYKVYVRYAESENFNVSAAAELNANITKDALMAYVEERFEGEVTLADAKDVAYLETLAEAATGENEEFDAKLAELSAKRAELVNGATNVVEKALKAGGALKGYAAAAVAVAATLGGISLIGAAVGLCVKTRKGGKKNEEK